MIIGNWFENAQSMIIGLSESFSFHLPETQLCYSNIVVHILFAVKGILPKDVEPMLRLLGKKSMLPDWSR